MSEAKHPATPVGPWEEYAASPAAGPWVPLIAAGPDMLEALKTIAAKSAPGQEVNVTDAVDLLCEIWNVARAALIKAGATS